MNLKWYKRPDWFAVLGVSRLYNDAELRLSCVAWQEGVYPFIAIELLSPGTEKEDLGQKTLREINQPPTKWIVYEQILRIPYYFVYNRYANELQAFGLAKARYQPLPLDSAGIWLEEAQLGLGLWQGTYQGVQRQWLRWYDGAGQWITTPEERERRRADSAEQEIARLKQLLQEAGLNPEITQRYKRILGEPP